MTLTRLLILIIFTGSFNYSIGRSIDSPTVGLAKSKKSNPKKKIKSGAHPRSLSLAELSQIKAVLVVGPVEEWEQDDIQRANVIANYLRSKGVTVKTFYTPNDKWENIVKASKGAHIFYYSGHGTTCGDVNHNKVGGLCLSNDVFIYSSTITKELKLHKNALILFNSVCYAAGTSASDNSDIGVNEAVARVTDYSQPFFKSGAAGYYVNNYHGSIVPFLKQFFSKKTIKEIYNKEASGYSHIECSRKNKYNSLYEVSVSSDKPLSDTFTRFSYENGVKKEERLSSFKQYNIAYTGKPDFTVLDFFK